MFLLDGRRVAKNILDDLKKDIETTGADLTLAIVKVGKNTASDKFISEKQKRAKEIGVNIRLYSFQEDISQRELHKKISGLAKDDKINGIVVQLPLPGQIDSQNILDQIPINKDPDILSSASWGKFLVGAFEVLPPVAGAVKEFFNEYAIDYKHAYTVVVGNGRLVGQPVSSWLKNEGATFAVIDENTKAASSIIKSGDIIISGVGRPKIIDADMIKEGAVVIDAGTSESAGKLVGDVDFNLVSEKTSFITPVPGGVGPVTVAMLLKNLISLAKNV